LLDPKSFSSSGWVNSGMAYVCGRIRLVDGC